MKYLLRIRYTNGDYRTKWFDTLEEAHLFINNEGDHVEDYDIIGEEHG